MIYLGIDVGMKGGIGVIYDDGTYNAIPMPATTQQVYRFLSGYPGQTVAIECVGSMPAQGVASTFKFGKGYGELLGICTALGMTILNPRPQQWKKSMLEGLDKSEKDSSILRSEQLFPELNLVPKGCRKPSDGMAEAILLAAYAQKECK